MSTSGISTGSSSYSADFQNVVSRAVAIASLPISLLTSQKTALTDQSTELESVAAKFTSLQSALTGIGRALDGSSYDTTVSDEDTVLVSVGTGAKEGNYSVLVQDVGAYATSLSKTAWNEASGAARPYTLKVGAKSYTIKGTDNSAAAVASAINGNYGTQVRATVVNVGSTASPDYRISLQAAKLGNTPVDIAYDGSSLQNAQAEGRLAEYIVNGSGKTVTSDSRNAAIATGLTVNLVKANTTAVNISVTRSTLELNDALTTFVDAYNAAVDTMSAQRGAGSGKLQGESIVTDLSRALSQIGTYNQSGTSVGQLLDLGLELGKNGKLTFNSFTLMAADLMDSGGVTAFLGSTTGGGFLKAAAERMKSLQDSSTGALTRATQTYTDRVALLESQISDKQDAVDRLQTRLEDQMAAADALISSMEQKYSYLSSMFNAMDTASRSY